MKNRFEVSTQGMRALHEGRPLWQLVKELIANCWDEEINFCKVDISHEGRGLIQITVEDDGAGFQDITDSWTLMKPTAKRAKADVRGRFNIGEKELLSVAKYATIETVGHTVKFPKEGGRIKRKNDRTVGTKILATVGGRQDEIQACVDMLVTFIPPQGVEYIVTSDAADVKPLVKREKVDDVEAILKTVIADDSNSPVRTTKRKTRIDVYRPIDDGDKDKKGGIYEMGIYIQDTEMPYDVDINQKVPLPPNRDVVSDSYLQDVYAETLNVTMDILNEVEAGNAWVTTAVEDDRTTDETVKKVMDEKFGENAMIKDPFNAYANEEAFAKGKDLIDGRSMSKRERERMKENGLETTSSKFQRPQPEGFGIGFGDGKKSTINLVNDHLKIAEFARWLSVELNNHEVKVSFTRDWKYKAAACFGDNNLTFNLAHLHPGKYWFANITEEVVGIIIHELSHADHGSHVEHRGQYNLAVESKMAKALWKGFTGKWSSGRNRWMKEINTFTAKEDQDATVVLRNYATYKPVPRWKPNGKYD